MNFRSAQQALSQYRTIEVEANAATANPHRVVQMLFGGAQDRIARAKGALLRGDRPAKGRDIGTVIDIFSVLQSGLNLPQGGALAANLASRCRQRIPVNL